jgi:tetratricopeptide (TPR) repeat protein
MYTPFLEKYAYGWDVREAPFKLNGQALPAIAHGGGINGFSTFILRFPKEKYLIVILDNTGQPTDPLAEKIARILYAQPYELPKMSIVPTLEKTIKEKGIEAGIAQYRELKLKESATYNFAERELNTLGYVLLRAGKLKEAVEIFRLNVEAYPQAPNTYDSLGEAYLSLNQKDLAIANYKKSVELGNANAAEVLKRLERPPVTVDAKVFDAYVGEYELAPGFVLRVFRDGEKFMTQATGQQVIEIVADSETVFSPRGVNAKLTFLKDAEGKVTGVQLDQGGRQTVGKKIK